MSPLGALSQAWVSAEASLPRGWQLVGLWRFGEAWIALSEGPDRAYLDASGRYPDQALRRLADALRERRAAPPASKRSAAWLVTGRRPVARTVQNNPGTYKEGSWNVPNSSSA